MFNFENKISSCGIYYSQYIASWIKSKGDFRAEVVRDTEGNIEDIVWLGKFRRWLKSTGLTDEEVYEVACMADTGKLELEEHSKLFLTE